MSYVERMSQSFDSPPTYEEAVASSYSEAVALKPIRPEVISEQPNHRLEQHPSESVANMIYSEENSPNNQTIIINRHEYRRNETHEDCYNCYNCYTCYICCKICEISLYCCLCCVELLRCVAEINK